MMDQQFIVVCDGRNGIRYATNRRNAGGMLTDGGQWADDVTAAYAFPNWQSAEMHAITMRTEPYGYRPAYHRRTARVSTL